MVLSLSPTLQASLFNLMKIQAQIDQTQLRLATGKRVNSALDDPVDFFASTALSNKASDLERLLDGIGQNSQTVKTALEGLDAIDALLAQTEAITSEALAANAFAPAETLNEQILAADPVGYWRLNETSGNTAANLGSGGGSINGQYQSGVTQGTDAIYGNGGDVVASFDGVNDRVRIPNSNLINLGNHSERTIELVFRANDTSSRQVLYEEGGGINALSIYVENGAVYVNGRDAGDWGPFNINASIEAGETYHVALVLDDPNNELRGYLNGELIGTGLVTRPLSSHSGGIGIGRLNGASYFHDGAQSGNGLAFSGEIAEVALYNTVISQSDLQARYNALGPSEDALQLAQNLETLKTQIDALAFDASYRGTNLLRSDTLTSVFNETRTSFLDTVGDDFSTLGLNLSGVSFESELEAELTLSAVRAAIDKVRRYSASLTADLNVIRIREQNILDAVSNHIEGSDKLMLADMNEEGAKLLALEAGQQLGITATQLAARSRANVLLLFL